MSTYPDLFPQPWRTLGLSVALGYVGLGSFGLLAPKSAAIGLGLLRAQRVDACLKPEASIASRPTPENPEASRVAIDSMILLGARDLSIGAALLTFYAHNKPKAMGVVTMSGMILCVVDVVWLWRMRQDVMGPLLGVGAAIWGYIGWNLLKL